MRSFIDTIKDGSFSQEEKSVRDRRNDTERRCGVDRRDITRMNYGDNHRRTGHDRRGLTFL